MLAKKYLCENFILLIILAIGLVIRILSAILYDIPPGITDNITYLAQAQSFLALETSNINHIMPFYPFILALFGGTTLGALFANIILSTLAIWLVYELTQTLFHNHHKAVIAAMIVSFYPFFIFYSLVNLTESLFIFLILAGTLCFYRKYLTLGNICFILAILTRPTFDFMMPLFIIAFGVFIHKMSIRQISYWLLRYTLIYIVLFTPWWLYQYHKYDQFVRFHLGSGIVIYSGNNSLNETGGGIADEFHVDMNFDHFQHITDPVLRDKALKQAGFHFMINNPGKFAFLAYKKFIRFWRLYPHHPTYQKPFYIVVSVLSFTPILLLFFYYFRHLRMIDLQKFSPILLMIAYLTAVHMVLIGSMRYRLPLEPFMIIIAVAGFHDLLSKNQKISACLDTIYSLPINPKKIRFR